MRICFLVIDGLNDLPIKELKNKTPLEIAKKDTLDFLASQGDYGLINILNFAPESDEAIFSLLGINLKYYPGRGILEAIGADLPLIKNAIYFRCNLAKIKKNQIIDFEAKVDRKKLKIIENKINKIDIGLNFIFKFIKDYRAVLIFKGKNLSDKVTNTNPAYLIYSGKFSKALKRPINKKYFLKKSKAITKKAKFTAKKLNELSEKIIDILKKDNLAILVRGASKVGSWYNKIREKYNYKDWVLISDNIVEIGIGKILNMKIEKYDYNLKKLAKKVSKILDKKNVYLQIKGPDSCSHRGDFLGKIREIEKIDKFFLYELVNKIKGKDVLLIITCDHITSTKYRAHCKGPTTFIKINMKNIKEIYNTKIKFSEKICKKIIKPKELLKI
ncbi:MAG: hypothetical protein QXQ30_01715 [Candidatus Pacearchaeota archaeon]